MAYLWGHSASFQHGWPGLLARIRQPLIDWLRNRLRLPAYHLGREELRGYLLRLKAFRPSSIYAYASAGYLLAQEAQLLGERLESLKAVILSAEPVYPEVARSVERAFGVPALSEYGSVESGMMAHEWPDRTLRVREDCVVLETVPRDDGRYDILLTVLTNPSFPLLRYAIGDSTAVPLQVPERGFAILGSVVGRKNDLILSRTGRHLHPILFDEIFSRHPAVRGWQVYQHRDGTLSIQVELKSPQTVLDRPALAQKVQETVEGYPVQLEVVKELSRSAAGKHRWIQSELADSPPSSGRGRCQRFTFDMPITDGHKPGALATGQPRLLLVHNYYQQRGGEDQSFEDDRAMLEAHGHPVSSYTLHNDSIDQMGRLELVSSTLWNRKVYQEVRQLIRKDKPRLMHCTNTFPLISPAVYYAARAEGVPVVQGLHNYRLQCLNGLFLRQGRVCEDCLGQAIPWPGVRHGCYRGSRAASGVLAGMLTLHRALGTWKRTVSLYYAVSCFARQKFIEAGWDGRRILVKPNCLNNDPGMGPGGEHAVFVGRLSAEKGIVTLLSAWDQLREGDRSQESGAGKADSATCLIPGLTIIGDGPMAEQVRQAARRNPAIRWLGALSHQETLHQIGKARFLVMPSIWYETFGRTIMEAFACGVPVLASRLGAMAELVSDGRTGFLFRPGDAEDLVGAVNKIVAWPDRDGLRRQARQEFEEKYTAARNYPLLRAVYDRAVT